MNTVYVVPMNDVYNGKYILAHSSEGKKINYMRSYPDVCFEVDEMNNIMNWRSVISLRNQVKTLQPGYIKVVVCRIAVNKKSGRFEKI